MVAIGELFAETTKDVGVKAAEAVSVLIFIGTVASMLGKSKSNSCSLLMSNFSPNHCRPSCPMLILSNS